MAEYRLYCLDGEGRIVKRHDLEAVDDAAALARARELDATAACELWSGKRKVGVLPALA